MYLYGSYITNPLINYAGIETVGTVISQEKTRTLHNYQRIYKMNVIYLKEDGELQKSSFRTDERNFYPSVDRAVYPNPGQEFILKYLPHTPTYFVIFNDLNKSVCRDLLRQVNELDALLQVAPNDSKLSSELRVISESHMEQCSNQPD